MIVTGDDPGDLVTYTSLVLYANIVSRLVAFRELVMTHVERIHLGLANEIVRLAGGALHDPVELLVILVLSCSVSE